jgi:hypothetical protein
MRRCLAAVLLAGCTGGGLVVDAGVDAGLDASACPQASITFSIHGVDPADFCIGAPTACTNEWLEIAGPAGPLAIDRPCLAECDVCQPVGCPALCAAPSPLPPEGKARVWDGTIYSSGVCGASLSCTSRSCAGPGHYTAGMCVFRRSAQDASPVCQAETPPTCTLIDFDWPPPSGAATVEGWVGSAFSPDAGADGGACCPSSWLMYGCTYSDGGAGLNCHNPALGCASSTTCGAGCDTAVAGRCTGG